MAIGIFTIGHAQTPAYEREVIVQLLPGTVKIPTGQTQARLENLSAIPAQLRSLLLQFNTEEVAKTFPTFEKRDTLKISRTGERVTLSNLSDIFTLRLPSSSQKGQLIEQLTKLPFVVYAEPNGVASPSVLPNDEYFDNPSSPGSGGRQWNLLNTGQDFGTNDADIDAPEAWDITKGSSSTVIGIIDGGVENWHEDLSGKVTGDTGWGWDGHGFHVAGIAAAKTNNTDGIAGVDWNAQIISQRIDNTDDSGTYNAVMDAINGGADIINNSWGLCSNCNTSNEQARYSTTVRRAFANAYKMNVIATVAMGNEEHLRPGEIQYPAGFGQGIIAVGNTNRNDQRRFTSSTGNHIDVSAPGTSILSTIPEQTSLGYYGTKTGTSMATPHVSGIAGLLLSQNPSLYNDDIENIIKLSAEDVNTTTLPGFDTEMGHGRVNAHKALLRLQSPYVLTHHTTSGGYVANVTQETKVFYDTPGLANGTYVVKRNEVQKTVTFPYMSEIHVWG